jgi:mono/diheme cytochrome c family protein
MKKFILLLLVAGCGAPPDPRVAGVLALTGDVANGETLFMTTQKCTECHGKAGRGGFGPDLGSADVHGTAKDELADTLLQGRWFMPAFKAKVTDQEAADLLAFMDTLGR